MAADVAPSIEGHPRGTANGRLRIGMGEPHAFFRQPVDIGCLDGGMTVAAKVIEPQLIEHDEEYVLRFGLHKPLLSMISPCGGAARIDGSKLSEGSACVKYQSHDDHIILDMALGRLAR